MSCYDCFKNCALYKESAMFCEDIKNGNPVFVGKIKNKELYFSPVGNSAKNPAIIICGQTPDKTTMEKFYKSVECGESLECAGAKNVYSNKLMRENLFVALSEIGFFEYIKKLNCDFINIDNKILWDCFYKNEISEVQLTQSCNCAIVEGNSSKQPEKSVFSQIERMNPDCLFNSFCLSEKLKLIIFLDSPSKDGRYHQIDFFKKTDKYLWCKENNVEIVFVPHPSGANRIYNNYDDLRKNKHIINAKKVIDNLLKA